MNTPQDTYTVMKNIFTKDSHGNTHISQKRRDNNTGRTYYVQVR